MVDLVTSLPYELFAIGGTLGGSYNWLEWRLLLRTPRLLRVLRVGSYMRQLRTNLQENRVVLSQVRRHGQFAKTEHI